MKKTLKIIGISLGCLVGLVVLAAIIACSTVTSSKQLTRLVKKYVPQYVPFDLQLEKANLTLFKTFPDIGLELDQVAVLSPMAGSPSDTLARIEKLTLSANARKFLKEKQIVVNRCLLENSRVLLFTDTEGHSNLDIFRSNDTDTASQPFNYSIDLQQVQLKNTDLSYIDLRSQLEAATQGLDIDLKGRMADDDIDATLGLQAAQASLSTNSLSGAVQHLDLRFDGRLDDFNRLDGTAEINSPDLCLNAGYQVLDHDAVQLKMPVTLDLKPLKAVLDKASIGLNDYRITLDGTVAANDTVQPSYALDLSFNTNTLVIEDLMRYLPENIVNKLAGMCFQGKAELADGKITGCYNDSTMPLITTHVNATDATVIIPSLPYPLKETNLSTLLYVNLNDSINANDIQLQTKLNRSSINANGNVTDLTRQLALDLNLQSDMPLTDLKPFLPQQIGLNGQADIQLKATGTLDDLLRTLTKYQFHHALKAEARIHVKRLGFDMDTIHASSPDISLAMTLPASRKIKGRQGAYLGLTGDVLEARVGDNMQADLRTMKLEGTLDNLHKKMEDYIAFAELQMGSLNLKYDTVTVEADQPTLELEKAPGKGQRQQLKASLKSDALHATAGPSYDLLTQHLSASATADTTADFVLDNAVLQIPQLQEKINIPAIDFVLDPHELDFRRGTVKIGKSDITLQGNVVGIDRWLHDPKNLLKADLQVKSNCLDVNEIMDLTSGLGASPDSTQVEEGDKEDNPFMVPEGIDFTFGIHAQKALYGNFEFNNLSGAATVKDGTLMLREIGFTNEAAEMQLTAIYQSPRKNHLFLGLDFHLLNVQIYDLLHMIPEIDTIVPMLKTFDGAAEFHIAAQTNLKSNYDLKMSTLRASADIEGANLRVKDIVTFSKITDMLKVSTNGEYKIDSIDIQMTAFRDEVDLWPFQICLGKYKATLDGHYKLNADGEYHISVTDSPLPTRLGLKISGPLNNLNYSLEPCKYPHLYRPGRRNDTEQLVMQLKQQIAAKLKENVQ